MNFLFAGLVFVSMVFSPDGESATRKFQKNAVNKNQSAEFLKIMEYYGKGQYFEAIELLEKYSQDKENAVTANYWIGHIQFKLQNYDAAEKAFKKVLNQNYQEVPANLFYEYGQTKYVKDDLKFARKMFLRSYNKKIKRGISLYYAGFISQTLENDDQALKYYSRLEKLPLSERKDVEQAAAYQAGEVLLKRARKKKYSSSKFEDKVLPMYELAYNKDPESGLAKDIQKQMLKTKEEFGLITMRLNNGKRVPLKRHIIQFIQSNTYDSNVVTVADEAPDKPENQASAIIKGEFFGKYTMPVAKRALVKPELRMNQNRHLERSSNIYKNDQVNINPAIRSEIAHKLFGKNADTLLEVEFAHNERDRDQTEEIKFYNRSYGINVGEKFRWFDRGDTAIRFKYKDTENYIETSNSLTQTVQINQTLKQDNGDSLILVGNFTNLNSANNANDADLYSFIANYIIPQWGWFNIINPGLTTTFTDPKSQRSSRGEVLSNYELLISPSFSISKVWKGGYKVTTKYAYTQVLSKDETSYAYDKHAVNLDFSVNF